MWTSALSEWAIPQEILDRAPESPYSFPPWLFEHAARRAETATTPSRERALEALPARGSVLDVGVGGGAASLPLVPPAAYVVGVDQSSAMLETFARAADQKGVAHKEVLGTWPDVAGDVDGVDVVVCHHVFYNAPDLVAFASALTARARRRVVVELTAHHPLSRFNDLWRRFHGIERPDRPTVDDAVAVLHEMGLSVSFERWQRPALWEGVERSKMVAFARTRLCLGPDRDPEIDASLDDERFAAPRDLATLWWPGEASS